MEKSERERCDGLRLSQHLFGGFLHLLFNWITTEPMWIVWLTLSDKKLTLAMVWGQPATPRLQFTNIRCTCEWLGSAYLGLKRTMYTQRNFAHVQKNVNDSGLLPQHELLWICLWWKCHVYVSEQISFSAFSAQAQLCSCSGGRPSFQIPGLGPTAATK